MTVDHNAEQLEPPPGPLSTVPLQRNKGYINRSALATELHQALSRPRARVALLGVGGAGKSQLALDFAHQLRETSPETWVLWLDCSTTSLLEQSVRETLRLVNVAGCSDPDANIFELLQYWLRGKKALVILDDAVDVDSLSHPEPPGLAVSAAGQARLPWLDYMTRDGGALLLTTRSSATAKLLKLDHVIKVDEMDQEQSLALLTGKLNSHARYGGEYSNQELAKLAKALHYMPGAIVQAAAYIQRNIPRGSIWQYLEKLEKIDQSRPPGFKVLDSHEKDSGRDRDAKDSIGLTWQLSFDRVLEDRPSATRLLSLMGFFNCQGIQAALLRNSVSDSDSNLQGPAIEDFENDVNELISYSLISYTKETDTFRMPRLVQLATQRWLESSEYEECCGRYLNILDTAFPNSSFETRKLCEPLFPHALEAVALVPVAHDSLQLQTKLLEKSGQYATQMGSFADALAMQKRSSELIEQLLGENDERTFQSMDLLAQAHVRRLAHTAAVQIYRKILARWQAIPRDGRQPIGYMRSLATVHGSLDQHYDSARIFSEALEKAKSCLGEDDPTTLTLMSDLTVEYAHLEQWESANQLGEETMKRAEEVFGKSHPQSLASVYVLSLIYQAQGKPELVIPLEEELLRMSKSIYGDEHPHTLKYMSHVGMSLHRRKNLSQAKDLLGEALRGRKKVLGEEHPDTLASMHDLATCLRADGDPQAIEILGDSVTKSENVLGIHHHATRRRKEDLHGWRREDAIINGTNVPRMIDLAEQFLRSKWWHEAARTLERYTALRGDDDESSLHHMAIQARVLFPQGSQDAAISLMERCITKSRASLGETHKDTISRQDWLRMWQYERDWRTKEFDLPSMSALTTMYFSNGRLSDAAKVGHRTLEKMKRELGEDHPETLSHLGALAHVAWWQGRARPAIDLMAESAAKSPAAIGATHQDTINRQSCVRDWQQELEQRRARVSDASARAVKALEDGDLDAALRGGLGLLKLQKNLLGETDPDRLFNMGTVAHVLYRRGCHADAIRFMAESANASVAVLGETHQDTVNRFDMLRHWEGREREKKAEREAEREAAAEREREAERKREQKEQRPDALGKPPQQMALRPKAEAASEDAWIVVSGP